MGDKCEHILSYTLLINLSVTLSCFAKPSFYKPNYKRMHPEAIQTMEKIADGKYDLRTKILGRMAKEQNGYIIITTKKKANALKSLPDFIKHKRSRGFKVSVVNEDQFGGGTGIEAAENIRQWLRTNYKKRRTLYVLMLGNPHPREGDIPFYLVHAQTFVPLALVIQAVLQTTLS